MSIRKIIINSLIAASVLGANAAFLVYEHFKPISDIYYSSNAGLYPDGMPKILYIDGKRWNVEIVEHDDALDAMEAFGVTLCKERVIEMHSNMVASNRRDTLIHETLHAHICKPDGSLDNDEYSRAGGHAAIAKFAQFWQSITRDNPELAQYLLNYKS